ncbi:LysR family transcriptional regulator [Pleomorphomonas diazotrophica]|uniref:LysR family transcriptional regulator n=1 Tax=Pleomorphomonas diazotrophica TaxID=1166257 RepID=A0A1I4R4N6_9HYPH|nr:LysR family transcriptional regulator [Pleomorphomonas diazotrophica]PKR90203.1 LysR family transcriptional regulator [Pleomorphomonas diazotrophica]SFM47221.1 DNA-binding transcriptional regulator, LysR family [Pleomorphomonas diazotrophica]
MARPDLFDGISEFLAVVRRGSFRAAAGELGVTPGAVSQAVQTLERRIGLPLFHRTTRHVALTEAGERLLGEVRPAADAIAGSLSNLASLSSKPSGTLRLLTHPIIAREVLTPMLPAFLTAYPDIAVEVITDTKRHDLVESGFDAGIRIGEFIDQDMLTVRVTPPFSWVVVGSPAYFAAHGRPTTPDDLAHHVCLRFRLPPSGDLYRWEFEREGIAVAIDPPGQLTSDDSALLLAMAVAGLGLTYASSQNIRRELADGRLETCLDNFAPAQDALYLYYPRSSRLQPKLRVFIEACLRSMRERSRG